MLHSALFLVVFGNKQERKQRAELQEGLLGELGRLRQRHEAEMKALQAELGERLAALQHRQREKVSVCCAAWHGLGALASHVPPTLCTTTGRMCFPRSWCGAELCLVREELVLLFNSASLCRRGKCRNWKASWRCV